MWDELPDHAVEVRRQPETAQIVVEVGAPRHDVNYLDAVNFGPLAQVTGGISASGIVVEPDVEAVQCRREIKGGEVVRGETCDYR